MTDVDDVAREPDAAQQLSRGLAFLRRACRFWHAPLLALLLGALAFAGFSFLRKLQYRSETVILYIERGAVGSAEPTQAERGASVRLRELLLSRPRLERVVEKFDLYPSLKRTYGMGDAIEELKKHIDFKAPGGDTFSIAFAGESPVLARDVTAELARSVMAGDSELRKQQARLALDFLASEKENTEKQLRESEQKLAAFMAEHPRFALDTTPLANGAAIRASLGASPAAPPRVRAPSAPRGAAVGSKSGTPSPAVASPPVALPANNAEEARARAALAAAREHLAEQQSHYTSAHPDVRAAEAAVERAAARLAALGVRGQSPANAAAAAAPPPPAPASASAAPAPALKPAPRPMAAAPAVAPATPAHSAGQKNLVDLETEWLQLSRAVTEARQRQDQVEAQLFRADIQAGSEAVGHGVHVSVIDPAYLPERPQPPGRTTIAAIFAAASLALGTLLALILAALDERMFIARDAQGITEILAEVPKGNRRAYVAG